MTEAEKRIDELAFSKVEPTEEEMIEAIRALMLETEASREALFATKH